MNLLNRVRGSSEPQFAEQAYLPDKESAVFRPWTAEEIRERTAAMEQSAAEAPCNYTN